jgi:hypothetical protein
MMSRRDARQHRITSEHPLMPMALYYPAQALTRLTRQTIVGASRMMWAIIAAAWTVSLFGLLRRNECRLVDASCLTMLGFSSAAATFWFAVPEVFAIGSLTIILALMLAPRAPNGNSLWRLGMANVLTLSMTITNWSIGLVLAGVYLRWRQALLVVLSVTAITSLLWGVQRLAFPHSRYIATESSRLTRFMHVPSAHRIQDASRAFFVHTMVMPQLQIKNRGELQKVLSVQQSRVGSAHAWGHVAAVSWILLLLAGILATFTAIRQSPLMRVVVVSTALQLGLHIVFGGETFLYSMHFLPLLILFVVPATRSRFRVPILALSIIVAITSAINNQRQFSTASEFIRSMGELVTARKS